MPQDLRPWTSDQNAIYASLIICRDWRTGVAVRKSKFQPDENILARLTHVLRCSPSNKRPSADKKHSWCFYWLHDWSKSHS